MACNLLFTALDLLTFLALYFSMLFKAKQTEIILSFVCLSLLFSQ